jgi:hypothetical protein
VGEGVVPDQAGVGQLAEALLQVVLHRGDVELEGVDVHLLLVRGDQHVGRVLRVLVSEDVAPGNYGKGELVDPGVDGGPIFGVPNDESVIFTQSR